jgi:hypothetical protein
MHLQYISKVQPTRCYVSQFVYFNKMLYMLQAVPPPIIGSSDCTYGFWYLSNLAAIMVVFLLPNRKKKHTSTETSKENCTRQMQQSGITKHAGKNN